MADIKWNDDANGYAQSDILISTMDGPPKLFITIHYDDGEGGLEAEGEILFDDLIASRLSSSEPADEQLALAKYFRQIAYQLEEMANT
jgi:hypothetical protein